MFLPVFAEIIRQCHQTLGKMNVLYDHILRGVKICMGKIPDCLDSIVNKNLRHLLGLILRQGQNGNLHLILPDKFRETANHLDLNPANGNPLQNRVYVKNPYQIGRASCWERV